VRNCRRRWHPLQCRAPRGNRRSGPLAGCDRRTKRSLAPSHREGASRRRNPHASS
jgi:hypothetical protein